MRLFNFHTHSKFCDGQGELEEYVQAALHKGFCDLGFSCHAPLPFDSGWTMRREDFPRYRSQVLELKERYRHQLEIFFGLEVDYLQGIRSVCDPEIQKMGLDYTVGSVHFLGALADGTYWTADGPLEEFEQGLQHSFAGNIRSAVEHYYAQVVEMVRRCPPDLVAHFDLIKKNNQQERFFSEQEAWYVASVTQAVEALARSGCVVEINTGGLTRNTSGALYPSQWILREFRKQDIPITVSSDAHRPEDLDGLFRETYALLKELGFTSSHRLTRDGWKEEVL